MIKFLKHLELRICKFLYILLPQKQIKTQMYQPTDVLPKV